MWEPVSYTHLQPGESQTVTVTFSIEDMASYDENNAKAVSYTHLEVPESPENLNPQAVRRIREYVELNYGKSYLSESEQARVNRKFCTGIHKNCILYLTDGILQNPVIKNLSLIHIWYQTDVRCRSKS